MEIAPTIETATMRRVAWRLLPFLMLSYLVAFIDRVNVGFAALQMNRDVGLDAAAFGLGSGLFFLSYALLEVPSNLILDRVGARIWIARIMITWGLISGATAFVQGPNSFYALRLLLGAAEAGFFPGVILYLTYWFPFRYRARIVAIFMIAIPISSFIGSPVSALLLQTDGWLGLRGWQWLFIFEALPAVTLGIIALFWLRDRPRDARWLPPAQRDWLIRELDSEQETHRPPVAAQPFWRLTRNRHVVVAALLCSASAAVSQCLSIWQPQILKSFGVSELQTGVLNALPFGLASILMVLWGRHSDATDERIRHVAWALVLVGGGLAATNLVTTLLPTVLLLCVTLTGVYAFKGPFWALATEWLAPRSAAGGVAYVNAVGAFATFGSTWLLGLIKDATGSYPLGLLPMAVTCVVAVAALIWLVGRQGASERRDAAALRQRT